MKLVITLTDQDPVTTKSLGILNVSFGLLRGFASSREISELHVLTNSSLGCPVPERPFGKISYHGADKPAPRRWGRVAWDQWGVVGAAAKIRPDWILFPKGFPPGIRRPRCRMAVFLQDLMWEHYEKLTTNPFPFLERVYFPWLSRVALRDADLVVTSSQWNVDRMKAHEPDARVERVDIGFDPVAPLWSENEAAGNGLLLLTSRFPHKLTSQAIDWLRRWKRESGDLREIHGVGGLGKETAWPDEPGWTLHPRLHGDAYREVRRKCMTVIYFSAYEGFGMPPVEALREGAFPLASDIPPHRENLPPECLFRNDSYGDFKNRLEASLDPSRQLPSAREFPDWNTVSERIVQLMLEKGR